MGLVRVAARCKGVATSVCVQEWCRPYECPVDRLGSLNPRLYGLNRWALSSLVAVDKRSDESPHAGPGAPRQPSPTMLPYVPPTSCEVGQVKAQMHYGSGAAERHGIIQKTDGTHPAQCSQGFCELFASAKPV